MNKKGIKIRPIKFLERIRTGMPKNSFVVEDFILNKLYKEYIEARQELDYYSGWGLKDIIDLAFKEAWTKQKYKEHLAKPLILTSGTLLKEVLGDIREEFEKSEMTPNTSGYIGVDQAKQWIYDVLDDYQIHHSKEDR